MYPAASDTHTHTCIAAVERGTSLFGCEREMCLREVLLERRIVVRDGQLYGRASAPAFLAGTAGTADVAGTLVLLILLMLLTPYRPS